MLSTRMFLSLVRATRPVNCLLAAGAALIGRYPYLGGTDLFGSISCVVAVGAICAGGNISNDLTDIPNDQINHPNRSIAAGSVPTGVARGMFISCYLAGLLCAFLCSLDMLLLAGGVIVGLEWYNRRLKCVPLAGNLLVSAATASTIIAGALSMPAAVVDLTHWVCFATALLLNLSREIVKDIADLRGDTEAGIRTLPHSIGLEQSFRYAQLAALLALLVSLSPLLLAKISMLYLLAVALVACFILVSFRRAKGMPLAGVAVAAEKRLKLAMLCGLIAFALLRVHGASLLEMA